MTMMVRLRDYGSDGDYYYYYYYVVTSMVMMLMTTMILSTARFFVIKFDSATYLSFSQINRSADRLDTKRERARDRLGR